MRTSLQHAFRGSRSSPLQWESVGQTAYRHPKDEICLGRIEYSVCRQVPHLAPRPIALHPSLQLPIDASPLPLLHRSTYPMRFTRLFWPLFVLLSLTATFSPTSQAQDPDVPSSVRTGDEYVQTFARPGRATHTIYIWGAVASPGIWKVETETDLVELLSVVRPTNYGTQRAGTRDKVVIRIHRSQGGRRGVVFESTMEELLSTPSNRRPSLAADDVVEIQSIQRRRVGFQTISTVVGTLSSLTILALRIFNVGG